MQTPSQPGARRLRLHDFITSRWLVGGYLVLLTGLFWIPDGSLYTKFYYAFLAAPALLAALLAPAQLRVILRDPVILSFLAFSLWLLISMSWGRAEESAGSLAKRPLYALMLFIGCALIAIKSEQLLLKTLRIGAAIGALAALINVAWFLYSAAPGARLIGTGALRNPLLTSHVLGFLCTYWIAAWLSRNERHDWLPILMAIPLLAALVATGSRTPLMGLVLTSCWMLLMSRQRAIYLNALLPIGAGAAYLAAPEIILQRGTSFRPELWADAWRQAGEHLWFGAGYNSKFEFDIPGVGHLLYDPHNVELAVLLELGLIGLALWATMYTFALYRCMRLRALPQFQIASALLIYGLSAGLTEGGNYLSRPNESWFLIWIPLALLGALSIRHRQAQA
ncbi:MULTISPECIES: O-antigen ligase family protein [unclassified Pseudomonas]|uniref:O-antigen ligase family protein n=1 Tax=unclassified Pseudomonas TaxID=196821 RepID=UPI0023B93FDA|nr:MULTISPECIES: O-antigen ligase family protein [Pseudomonas]MDH1279686.1 O-antigen ligase family protein [Pseudomonas chengduensis]